MSKHSYEHLLQPGQIGITRIKNRMVRMAAHPGFPDYEDGFLQPFYSDLWISFAKGGAGLIGCGVSPAPGVGWSLDDDKYIPRVLEMNKKIHEYGAASYVQMFHVGPWMPAPMTVAASSLSIEEIPLTVQNFPDARPMTIPEIKDIVTQFGQVAERARRAGFDMAEINAGCNHLFGTFLSRVWNKREDEYGCASLENRSRFVVELIKEIKARAGKDFGVIVVYNAAEPGVEKGITVAGRPGIGEDVRGGGCRRHPRPHRDVHHAQHPRRRATARTSPTWRSIRRCPSSPRRAEPM